MNIVIDDNSTSLYLLIVRSLPLDSSILSIHLSIYLSIYLYLMNVLETPRRRLQQKSLHLLLCLHYLLPCSSPLILFHPFLSLTLVLHLLLHWTLTSCTHHICHTHEHVHSSFHFLSRITTVGCCTSLPFPTHHFIPSPFLDLL